MTAQEFLDEYERLAHAVQSGIKMKLERDLERGDKLVDILKHIRVGVDTMKSDEGALTRLLIKKGVFTDEEYFAAILEGLADEVKLYEQELAKEHGVIIKLL